MKANKVLLNYCGIPQAWPREQDFPLRTENRQNRIIKIINKMQIIVLALKAPM